MIDVYVSARRDIVAARSFFTAALTAHGQPDEVVTDDAPTLEHVIEELLPAAFHNTETNIWAVRENSPGLVGGPRTMILESVIVSV